MDFATPDAKLVAITWSERNLEGRRLLIKDGVYVGPASDFDAHLAGKQVMILPVGPPQLPHPTRMVPQQQRRRRRSQEYQRRG